MAMSNMKTRNSRVLPGWKTPAPSGGAIGTADADSKEDLRLLLTRKRVLFGEH
jgi:hypothetical protein